MSKSGNGIVNVETFVKQNQPTDLQRKDQNASGGTNNQDCRTANISKVTLNGNSLEHL